MIHINTNSDFVYPLEAVTSPATFLLNEMSKPKLDSVVYTVRVPLEDSTALVDLAKLANLTPVKLMAACVRLTDTIVQAPKRSKQPSTKYNLILTESELEHLNKLRVDMTLNAAVNLILRQAIVDMKQAVRSTRV